MEHTSHLPIARPVVVNQAPDWASFLDEIECPLCGYNLRGLSEARCPECGGVFEWRDLLDPNCRRHAYLFEYDPKASAGSFFRTMIAGVRTNRFWKSVHPVLPVRIGRLTRYGLNVFVAMFLSFVVGLWAIDMWQASLPRWRIRMPGSALAPWTWSVRDLRTVLSVNSHFFNYVIWFLATFGAMLVFQGSMRRKRIRVRHLYRCMIYSSDVFVWLAAVLVVLDVIEAWSFGNVIVTIQYVAFASAVFFAAVRLIAAFRDYLQFPHPAATVVATQVIVILLISNIYIVRVWF
ncbi:MAG: hypothetical protein H6819_10045 [Phycisphaerales bacterium]|nr:hypothetical protein [Phycisphaerales bacterium]MCB9857990.1 hypothetical protein [Phycisphaerales bacterium]